MPACWLGAQSHLSVSSGHPAELVTAGTDFHQFSPAQYQFGQVGQDGWKDLKLNQFGGENHVES